MHNDARSRGYLIAEFAGSTLKIEPPGTEARSLTKAETRSYTVNSVGWEQATVVRRVFADCSQKRCVCVCVCHTRSHTRLNMICFYRSTSLFLLLRHNRDIDDAERGAQLLRLQDELGTYHLLRVQKGRGDTSPPLILRMIFREYFGGGGGKAGRAEESFTDWSRQYSRCARR